MSIYRYRIDFGDHNEVKWWLTELHISVDQHIGVTRDLLRPYRLRRLGHLEHARVFHESHLLTLGLLMSGRRTVIPYPDDPPGHPSRLGRIDAASNDGREIDRLAAALRQRLAL